MKRRSSSKNNKQNAKKRNVRNKFSLLNFEPELDKLSIKDFYWYKSKWYFLFAPKGINSPCDAIGIDIGYVHLVFVGLCLNNNNKFEKTEEEENQSNLKNDSITKSSRFNFIDDSSLFDNFNNNNITITKQNEKNENDNYYFPYKISWLCVMNIQSSSLNRTLDILNTLLSTELNLEWIRSCPVIRIEQQFQKNKKAQKILICLRTCLRTISMMRGVINPDIEIESAEHKYLVAPLLGLRDSSVHQKASGIKNKSKRKKIAIEDFIQLMELNQENDFLEFINNINPSKRKKRKKKSYTITTIDKLDDISDAYLIIRYYLEKKLRTT